MAVLDPSQLDNLQRYRWLTACLVPRPIAWVSTRSEMGVDNLAPFSFFGGISTKPPLVMISVGPRKHTKKDTATNLLSSGEGIIHIPPAPMATAMVATSAEVDPSVDEFCMLEKAGVSLEGVSAGQRVAARRIGGDLIAMECRLERHLEVGDGPNDVFFLEILLCHVPDQWIGDDGLPVPDRIDAIGRLGGSGYTDIKNWFEVPRP